jgi:hypothetical protein
MASETRCLWRLMATILSTCVVLMTLASAAHAQNADWTEPFPPFRIAGNLYRWEQGPRTT